MPQRPYQPIQSSPDPGHWNGETLSFSKGGCGIRVLDAAENRLSGLVGGDDFMFVDTAVSTFSLRIEVRCSFGLQVGSWRIDPCHSGRGTVCGRERCV